MLEDIIKQGYEKVIDKFWVYESNTSIKLSTIVLKDDYRNSGIGTEIMNNIVRYADTYNKIITLTPASDYGGNVSRLILFYKRFGFVMNKGSNKDYKYQDTMIRYPKNINENLNLNIVDEAPDNLQILISYDNINIGIINVYPINENTLEIISLQYKEEFQKLSIFLATINSLWIMFKNIKEIIVKLNYEDTELWNKANFHKFSNNYYILRKKN